MNISISPGGGGGCPGGGGDALEPLQQGGRYKSTVHEDLS